MSNLPIVRSKITMPQLPDSIVISERIRKLVNNLCQKKTVTITAPSGYGKTTLMLAALSSYREKKCRISWFRLEQEDNDLAYFYTYLIESLFPKEDAQWKEIRRQLENFADYPSQYRYLNAIICQELWAFCDKNPNLKLFIVFDDYQHVMDSLEISESLAYFAGNLHENCTMIVSSRQEIDFLTEKQKIEKSVLEINRKALYFNEKEISELLVKSFQINAGKKFMHKILTGTEGWVAGIILICQIVSDYGIDEADSLLEKEWQKTKLFSYITSEVLKAVNSDMMLFLVKTAILHDFTVEEVQQIFGITNAGQLIMQCEKKGLFIQKIIRDNITYRFHSLFRDTLLYLQKEYLPLEDIRNLNLKAAAYYLEHKTYDRAIEHFIACGDIASAVELITKENVALMPFEAVSQLRVWFKLLPTDVVEQNPTLLYIKSFTYHQVKSTQPIILMEKALIKFKEKNDINMQLQTLLILTNYHTIANNIGQALKAISRAKAIIKPIRHGSNIKTISRIFTFMQLICEEKISRALVFARHLINHEMREDWKWLVLEYSCTVSSYIGDLHRAESIIHKIFELNLVKGAELFRGYALTLYSGVCYLKNDAKTLATFEDELRKIGEKFDLNFMLSFGKRSSAYMRYVMHDLESALNLLDASNDHFLQYGNTAEASFNTLCKLLWVSRNKNSEHLFQEATIALQTLSSRHAAFCINEIGQSVYGAIARECKEYKLAEEHLLASVKTSEAKGTRQILSGTYFHLAKLYFDMGNKASAKEYLNKAMTLAADNRYSMFWDIHLPTLTEMLLYSIKSGIYTGYAFELLDKFFKAEAVQYIKRYINVSDENSLGSLSEKVILNFSSIGRTDSSCIIDIQLLGKFRIAINGVNIPDEEWKTKKIKGILEYLILNRRKSVSRDKLMEVFWPDSDQKNASVSLRAALYELKKVLTKYGINNEGHNCLIHEKAGSLEIKRSRMLFTDIDEYLYLYQEYQKHYQIEADYGQKVEILKRMAEIYKGDLLGAESSGDLELIEREELRSIFIETSVALALLYINNNEAKNTDKLLQKVLSIDPYNEEACLALLKLYVSTNQKIRAVKLYKDFKNKLWQDLEINPDESLTLAIKEII